MSLYDPINDKYLRVVGGIDLTQREIEVLACLLCGQKVNKQIAYILSITEKTSQIHISNILRKIGYRSREQVIDWLKQSEDQQELIKLYNQILLPEAIFKETLEKIALILKSKNKEIKEESCLIIYSEAKREHLEYTKKLKEYLSILGVKRISTRAKEQYPSVRHVLESLTYTPDMCLCIIPWDQMDSSKHQKQSLNVSDILKQKRQLFSKAIFLLLENTEKIDLATKEYVNFSECLNHYLGFFRLITKIWPYVDVEPFIQKFQQAEALMIFNKDKKTYLNDLMSYSVPSSALKNERSIFYWYVDFLKQGKSQLFIGLFLCVTSVLSLIFMFVLKGETNYQNREVVKFINYEMTSYVPEILTSHEKFIGREKELFQLADLFKKHNVVVITGRPGIGKSTLAIEYGKREKKKKLVRYFNADTVDKMDQKYRYLAQELGINPDFQDRSFLIQLINNKLSALNKDIIFIFDNVNRYEDVRDHLENLPQNVFVVITTTQPLLADKIHFRLQEFNQDEAKEYIRVCLKDKPSGSLYQNELIETVGRLPYNLKCTLAYITENPLKDIKMIIKMGEIRSKFFQQFAESKDIVRAQAWKILQYAAYLDPDFIDIEILKAHFLNEASLAEALKKLESLSLIVFSTFKDNIGIRIHRELQKEIKQTLRKQKNYKDSIITSDLLVVLDKLLPEVDHKPNSQWQRADRIIPHVKKLIGEFDVVSIQDKKYLASLYSKLSQYYTCISIDRDKAEELGKVALEKMREVYPANHLYIANCLDNLGSNYLYTKDGMEKGLAYIKKGLEIRAANDNHIEIAKSLRNLGLAYLRLEDFELSLKYAVECLLERQSVYKQNHPSVAEALNDVAWVHYELGNNEKSEEFVKKSLDMYYTLYPNGDPCMIYVLHTYGALLLKSNMIEEALKIFQESLSFSETFNMHNHYTTALILYDIGCCYQKKGDLKKALDSHLKSFYIREELHKNNGHLNQINKSIDAIGQIYEQLGNKVKALEFYEKLFLVPSLSLLIKNKSEILEKIRSLKIPSQRAKII